MDSSRRWTPERHRRGLLRGASPPCARRCRGDAASDPPNHEGRYPPPGPCRSVGSGSVPRRPRYSDSAHRRQRVAQSKAICRCARGACTLASSRADACLPPAPPGSGECGVLGLPPAWHLRPEQMNSLRARGVMSFHAASAVGLAISALCRSPGRPRTTPPGKSRAAHRTTVAGQDEPSQHPRGPDRGATNYRRIHRNYVPH